MVAWEDLKKVWSECSTAHKMMRWKEWVEHCRRQLGERMDWTLHKIDHFAAEEAFEGLDVEVERLY